MVGDIDVDRIEGKIKEMFSKIEKPVNPAERVYFPVATMKSLLSLSARIRSRINMCFRLCSSMMPCPIH